MFTLLLYLKHLYKLGLLTLNIDLNLSFSFISEESKQTMVIVINGNLGVWQKGKTQEPLTPYQSLHFLLFLSIKRFDFTIVGNIIPLTLEILQP